MQLVKERGLGNQPEDNPFKSEKEQAKKEHAEILKVR